MEGAAIILTMRVSSRKRESRLQIEHTSMIRYEDNIKLGRHFFRCSTFAGTILEPAYTVLADDKRLKPTIGMFLNSIGDLTTTTTTTNIPFPINNNRQLTPTTRAFSVAQQQKQKQIYSFNNNNNNNILTSLVVL